MVHLQLRFCKEPVGVGTRDIWIMAVNVALLTQAGEVTVTNFNKCCYED